MFSYNLSERDKNVSIQLIGDLDIEATEILEEITSKLDSYNNIELDFDEVPFVDSTGIGLLINLIETLKENDEFVGVKVRNIQPLVKEVFDILQLDEILGKEVLD